MGYANHPTLQQADDILNAMLCGQRLMVGWCKPIHRNCYLVNGESRTQIDRRLVTMLDKASKIRRETVSAEWYEWKPNGPNASLSVQWGDPNV